MKTMNSKQKFELRKAQYKVTMFGTKVAIGQCLTKKDIHDIKKMLYLFRQLGYTNYVSDLGNILRSSLKNLKRKHLTLLH